MPFKHPDGQIYDKVGNKTIRARVIKGGWSKCIATLILYPSADGILCVKAILIFRGKGHVTPEEV